MKRRSHTPVSTFFSAVHACKVAIHAETAQLIFDCWTPFSSAPLRPLIIMGETAHEIEDKSALRIEDVANYRPMTPKKRRKILGFKAADDLRIPFRLNIWFRLGVQLVFFAPLILLTAIVLLWIHAWGLGLSLLWIGGLCLLVSALMVFSTENGIGTEDAYFTTKNHLATGGDLKHPKLRRRYGSTYCKRAGIYGAAVEAGVESQLGDGYTRPFDICGQAALKRNIRRAWLLAKRRIRRSAPFLRTLSR